MDKMIGLPAEMFSIEICNFLPKQNNLEISNVEGVDSWQNQAMASTSSDPMAIPKCPSPDLIQSDGYTLEDIKPEPNVPSRCTFKECTYSTNDHKSMLKHLSGHELECDLTNEDRPVTKKASVDKSNKHKCNKCDYKTNSLKKYEVHRKSHECKCANKKNHKTKCPLSKFKCTNRKCQFKGKTHKDLVKHRKKCNLKVAEKTAKVVGDNMFNCKLCTWSSKFPQKILLHLIHHPNQEVDDDVIDVTPLRKFGIMQ